jgi:hypothetical protein
MSSEYAKLLNALPRPDLYDSWELVKRHMPIEQPPSAASYIVFQKGGQCYAKNGTTGHIEFGPGDASTVIQSAINSLSSGGKIFIKAGTYYAQNINTKSFVEIYGEGIMKTIIKRNADYPIFNFKEKSGTSDAQEKCVLADMALDGGGDANTFTSNLIEIDQLKDSTFKQLYGLYFKKDFFYITGTSTVKSFWNRFFDIQASSPTTAFNTGAIFDITQYAIDSWVERVYSWQVQHFVYSLRCAGGWNFLDCWGAKCLNTVYLKSDNGGIYDFTFQNLKVDTPISHGIYMNATVGIIQDIVFRDTLFITMPAGVDNVYLEVASGKEISKLVFDGIGGSSVANRYIFNKQGTGTLTHINIINNMHATPASGRYNGITISTTRKILNDPYYVTENGGTATFSGNGSTKTFTIAHGLASTPTKVLVTAGSDAAKGDFYVTADATNITVTYATAPASGTNNVVLNWYAEM